ncbi:MAG TPA: hypothetical protein VMW47_03450 [Verrucomicrobiae bacterium]|nr:hypothetical protein [Verrucomicrobiae bacterium]
MAAWFLRGIRRRVVTTRYPRGHDPWTADLPAPPAFDPGALTVPLANAVASVCPSRALWLDAGDLVLDLGRCTACGRCLEVAGTGSRSSSCIELSTPGPRGTLVRIPIGGSPG